MLGHVAAGLLDPTLTPDRTRVLYVRAGTKPPRMRGRQLERPRYFDRVLEQTRESHIHMWRDG